MSFQHKANTDQLAVFTEFRTGKQNLVIQAFAGCAKTTTVIEGVNHAPEKSILMCAFAKTNADELKEKVNNPYVTARTLHSAGNAVLYKRAGKVAVDERRGQKIAKRVLMGDFHVKNPHREALLLTEKLASAGKNINPFATVEQLVTIAKDFDHVPKNDELGDGEKPLTVEDIATFAHKAMERATEFDGSIDYDDMIFLPVRLKLVAATYDLVVVDEYQDMNPTQLMLARALCKGRIVLVGDEFQAIYEFRGANADFARSMIKELDAKVLSLSTTFRCPKAVVAAAQKLVPGYKAAPEAPEGVVRTEVYERMFSQAAAGDFILSRKNAPLAKICLRLLRDGKRALIRGRKIGEGLVSVINGREAGSILELFENLETWEANVIAGYIAQKAPQTKIELIHDQANTIRFLAEGLTSVPELIARINSIFNDATPGNSIICSSVHRAKGLEATRVFLLVDTLYPKKEVNAEETHIHYVALTRAKHELVKVTGGTK